MTRVRIVIDRSVGQRFEEPVKFRRFGEIGGLLRIARPPSIESPYLLRGRFARTRHLAVASVRKQATTNTENRIPLVGLLVVQLAIGYEWTMSGLTKVVRGDFPAGLALELRDKSQGAASWYTRFLDDAVIPHGSAWGYAIEIGELLVGIALIATALIWLLDWERVRGRARDASLLVLAAAAVAGILMNIGFHLANGSPHPWLIPRSGFDEGVDLDSLMPFIQLVFAAVSLKLWAALRRARREAAIAAAPGPLGRSDGAA